MSYAARSSLHSLRFAKKMVKSKFPVFEKKNLLKKYGCLYDKDKNRKKNAWKKVEETLGFEEGILILLSYCVYWTGQTYFGIQSLDVFLLF